MRDTDECGAGDLASGAERLSEEQTVAGASERVRTPCSCEEDREEATPSRSGQHPCMRDGGCHSGIGAPVPSSGRRGHSPVGLLEEAGDDRSDAEELIDDRIGGRQHAGESCAASDDSNKEAARHAYAGLHDDAGGKSRGTGGEELVVPTPPGGGVRVPCEWIQDSGEPPTGVRGDKRRGPALSGLQTLHYSSFLLMSDGVTLSEHTCLEDALAASRVREDGRRKVFGLTEEEKPQLVLLAYKSFKY